MKPATQKIINDVLAAEHRAIKVQTMDEVEIPDFVNHPIDTGIPALNQLFGGNGIVPSQVITLDAYRGSGKTTMLLQMLDRMVDVMDDYNAVFISKEEPAYQVKRTAKRIGLTRPMQLIGDDQDVFLEDVVDLMEDYDLIVVDSYSCLDAMTPGLGRDTTKMEVLKKAAKTLGTAVILVLHQTKSGAEKGGSDIAHKGDTCISLSAGDVESFGEEVRIFTVTKNRFGACGKSLFRFGRNGYDFESPVEEAVNNDANRNEYASAQQKRPIERKAILKLMAELEERNEFLTLSTLSICIDDEDEAAFGRHERHLKQMDMIGGSGHVMKVGRGKSAHWELTDKGRDALKA